MAAKRSAGILLYRRTSRELEVLLVHPGGPFWAKKDDGAWFIPKGEVEPDEEPLATAVREFREELGCAVPAGDLRALGTVKNKSGKAISAWAVEGEIDLQQFKSNTFQMVWPPRSGEQREFPEVDRARFFALPVAKAKLHSAELPLLERLCAQLAEPDAAP